jgi:hypothetical protein
MTNPVARMPVIGEGAVIIADREVPGVQLVSALLHCLAREARDA